MKYSKEKKIAYLISKFPAVSCTFIFREIENLRALGFEIKIASINETDIPFKNLTREEKEEIRHTLYIKKKGVLNAFFTTCKTMFMYPLTFFRVIGFSFENGGFNLKKIIYNLCYLVEACVVGQWMKVHHIKHLHVHFANPASFVALLVSKIFNFTYSITVHGPDEFYDVTLNSLKEKIERANFICCIGYYARSQIMKLTDPIYWSKYEITPMGVNTVSYSRKIPISTDSIIHILNVGRLTPSKGQLTLINAFNNLIKKEINSIHLTIVGEGPERKKIEELIIQLELQTKITLKGALSQHQVRDLYKKTDIFVLPSFAEGIPVVLMEAMSMEIPTIATNINGIPELIQHEVDGILVFPSDDVQLSEAIEKLINSPKLRESLGKAARAKIFSKFNINPNALHLGKIFAQRIPH
jgi:colanic acid/amylovoran biosynthesis glycosyltransferase